jgi:hypothetical protein
MGSLPVDGCVGEGSIGSGVLLKMRATMPAWVSFGCCIFGGLILILGECLWFSFPVLMLSPIDQFDPMALKDVL